MTTKDRIRERRLDRMRLGQAVCDFVPLVSDPEIRVAIVPLTEAEFSQALQAVAQVDAPDNLAGFQMRDRRQSQEVIVRAIREESELSQRVYENVDEMLEDLNVTDVDEIMSRYNEMVEQSSPSLEGIPPEEFENLKQALQVMDWNELSGPAWYAAKRFLSKIGPQLLVDSLPGFTSTSSLTTTSE